MEALTVKLTETVWLIFTGLFSFFEDLLERFDRFLWKWCTELQLDPSQSWKFACQTEARS
jgi:hypothetical protein